MTEAEKAFAAAEEAIKNAVTDSAISLDLSGSAYQALEVVPAIIGQLRNLGSLALNDTQISDATPLAGLSRLKELNLSNTQIRDAAPLAGLSRLAWLDLSHTQFFDAKPLADLTSLTDLLLDVTRVSNIAPLGELTALTRLDLYSNPVSDIEPIAGLTELRRLDLDRTLISDAKPLTGLSKLKVLGLNYTRISDLRPLRTLSQLAENPDLWGLTFLGCVAAKEDLSIAEIADIKDNKRRARTLFDYLETWEPPATPGDTTPPPDEIFPVEVVDERLEMVASSPAHAEREEALKQAMHKALKDLSERLAQAAGNEFHRLAEAARRLLALLDRDFEELEMPLIYLALGEMRTALKEGAEEGRALPDPVTTLLTQVMEAGPALVLGNPDVELMIERVRRLTAYPDPAEDRATLNKLSRAFAADKSAGADAFRSLQKQVAARDDPEAIVSQKAMLRNSMIEIGLWALKRVDAIGTGVVTATAITYGPTIADFAASNWITLKQAAATFGPVFLEWFIAAASKLQEVAAVIASSERRPK